MPIVLRYISPLNRTCSTEIGFTFHLSEDSSTDERAGISYLQVLTIFFLIGKERVLYGLFMQ
jgi:hypothetical protein